MSVIAEPLGREALIDGLFVQDWGTAGCPPVLFSAGLGGSGQYWKPQIAALARDYHVIIYDHRGTGRSERADLPLPYTATNLAADMLTVLDGLGLTRSHVVGHAAGGLACMQLALDAPERVSTLTVVNGWARADPHFLRCLEIRRDILSTSGADGYLKAQPLFLYPASWISDNLSQLDAERAAHIATFQSDRTLLARMDALRVFDIQSELGQLAPSLLIAADDDMLVPARASVDLAGRLSHSTLMLFRWGGHAVNVTDPQRFNQVLLDFLNKH